MTTTDSRYSDSPDGEQRATAHEETQRPGAGPAAARHDLLGDALLVTPEEAARRLSLGRTTVYGLIATGELASVTIGRCRRVPVSALCGFVERLLVAAPPATPSPYDQSLMPATRSRYDQRTSVSHPAQSAVPAPEASWSRPSRFS